MKLSNKLWTAVICLVALALLVAMLTPNLLRSRYAAKNVSQFARLRAYATLQTAESQSINAATEKKLIRKAELEFTVTDVNAATAHLRTITEALSGQIDQVRLVSADYEQPSGEMHLRVPADQLESALAAYKKVAQKVTHEQLDIQDVTRQTTDNDARLRNLHAEESQYLQIMKRAGSIKDTVAVAEKLSAVRGEIEQLQADMNLMAHDVAMSSVSILLRPAPTGTSLLADWHPLAGSHEAIGSLFGGVSAWVSFVVGAIILLPAILLWALTIGCGAFAVYWTCAWLLRRFAAKSTAAV